MENDAKERFARYLKTDRKTGCLNWSKSIRADGYGQFRLNGTTVKANRAAWVLFRGPIPDGQCVLHRCDNRRCCNPEHLFIGDRPTNSSDMVGKSRSAKWERHSQAKLTIAKVAAIRQEHSGGSISMRALGRKHGVVHETIRAIIHGRTWV